MNCIIVIVIRRESVVIIKKITKHVKQWIGTEVYSQSCKCTDQCS